MITSVSDVSYGVDDFRLLELEECVEWDFHSELDDVLLASTQGLETRLSEFVENTSVETSGLTPVEWESAVVPEAPVLKSESLAFIANDVTLSSVCEDVTADVSVPVRLIPVPESVASEPVLECPVSHSMAPETASLVMSAYIHPQQETVVVEEAIEAPVVNSPANYFEYSEHTVQILPDTVEQFSEPLFQQTAPPQPSTELTATQEAIPAQLKSTSEPVEAVGERLSTMWVGADKKARFTMSTETLGVIDGQIKQAENRITLSIQSPEASVDILKSHRDVFRAMVENSFAEGEPQRADVAITAQGEKDASFGSREQAPKYFNNHPAGGGAADTASEQLHHVDVNSLIDTYA